MSKQGLHRAIEQLLAAALIFFGPLGFANCQDRNVERLPLVEVRERFAGIETDLPSVKDMRVEESLAAAAVDAKVALTQFVRVEERLSEDARSRIQRGVMLLDELSRDTNFAEPEEAARLLAVENAYAKNWGTLALYVGNNVDIWAAWDGEVRTEVTTVRQDARGNSNVVNGIRVFFVDEGTWVYLNETGRLDHLDKYKEGYPNPSSPTKRSITVGDYRFWGEQQDEKTSAQLHTIRPASEEDHSMKFTLILE